MGKIKSRRRLHNKAAKAVKGAGEEDRTVKETPFGTFAEPVVLQMPDVKSKAPSLSGKSGIFKGVKIDTDALKAQLTSLDDDDDAKSTVTSKSFRGLGVKKKDKRKIKHDVWMNKIDRLNQAKQEAKEKKKRQRTAIVGDMKTLEDTLPTLELLLKQNFKGGAQSRDEVTKPKQTKKTKTRQKEMNDNISIFKQVLQHPQYQQDPFATINEHLQNKLLQEEQMDS